MLKSHANRALFPVTSPIQLRTIFGMPISPIGERRQAFLSRTPRFRHNRPRRKVWQKLKTASPTMAKLER